MQNPKPSTYVFERGGRIGGRLLSIDLLPQGHLKAELGGMRFTKEHRIVNALINELKRSNQNEHPLDSREFNFETKLMYLRARHLRFNENWREQLRYDLPDLGAECDLGSVALSMAKNAIQRSLEHATVSDLHSGHLKVLNDQLTKKCLGFDEWRAIQSHASVNGIKLHDLGFWNLLQHCLHDAPDEFLFLHDALGYESLVANSNAAQAIPVFLADFDVDGYQTLKGGMEALPRLLAFRSRIENGTCVIADQHEVESVTLCSDDREPLFELRVKCTPSAMHRGVYYFSTYRAKRVILALPKRALGEMRFIGFPESRERTFRESLDDVNGHPAVKLFLSFATPWWEPELGLKARAVTDLPIRQVYYMGEEQSPDGPALVMASYNDEHYVDFWEPLVNDVERDIEAISQRENALVQGRDISRYVASARIIKKAISQLELMHPKLHIPLATGGVVHQWKDAWHFWNVHSLPWETAEEMVKPFEDVNLHVCGEAYSLEQGWVEGALKSAERVLQEMGLAPYLGEEDFRAYISH